MWEYFLTNAKLPTKKKSFVQTNQLTKTKKKTHFLKFGSRFSLKPVCACLSIENKTTSHVSPSLPHVWILNST